MEVMQFLVISVVVLAVSGLTSPRRRGMRIPPYWQAKLKNSEMSEDKPAGELETAPSSLFAQQAGGIHSNLYKPAGDQLRWQFPEDPVDPVKKPPVQFKVQEPVVFNRVAVRCGESKVQVEVNQDMLGLGTLINPDEITLGGCPVADVDDDAHVLIFESELHDCGSTLEMKGRDFLYAFSLIYKPKMLGKSPIIRSQHAVIRVECHYTS
ncbi:uncharacterized protein FYW49_001361 [Xenentodon cancila]